MCLFTCLARSRRHLAAAEASGTSLGRALPHAGVIMPAECDVNRACHRHMLFAGSEHAVSRGTVPNEGGYSRALHPILARIVLEQ